MEDRKQKDGVNVIALAIVKGLALLTISVITVIIAAAANLTLHLLGNDPSLDLVFILICFIDSAICMKSFISVAQWQPAKS